MFNVGDKVMVVRKIEEASEDWNNIWVDDMNYALLEGTVHEIVGIDYQDNTGYRLNTSAYAFPAASFEKFEEIH